MILTVIQNIMQPNVIIHKSEGKKFKAIEIIFAIAVIELTPKPQ